MASSVEVDAFAKLVKFAEHIGTPVDLGRLCKTFSISTSTEGNCPARQLDSELPLVFYYFELLPTVAGRQRDIILFNLDLPQKEEALVFLTSTDVVLRQAARGHKASDKPWAWTLESNLAPLQQEFSQTVEIWVGYLHHIIKP